MFSLINLILTIVNIIICCSIKKRVYEFDKFYLLTYDMRLKEDRREDNKKMKK